MPTAEQFTAFGVGNGFPSCITKIDMTESSGGTWAPPVINALTLKQAMNLYWNLYGIVGTASATGTTGGTATVSDINIPDTDTPIKRVCGGSYSAFEDDNPGAPDFPYASQSIFMSSSGIIAMYDGDTSVESNFLGYSFGDIASCSANTFNLVETILFAGSTPNPSDFDAWTQLSSIYVGYPPTLTNVTYQGIPFILAKLELLESEDSEVSATITDVSLYTYE